MAVNPVYCSTAPQTPATKIVTKQCTPLRGVSPRFQRPSAPGHFSSAAASAESGIDRCSTTCTSGVT